MFKMSVKAFLLIGTLLIAQCNPIKAGGGDYSDLKQGYVFVGLVGIGSGIAGGTLLFQSFQWAKNGSGFKKYLGRSILGTAGIGTLIGVSYFLGKLSK